jgi:hypothetical protein
MEINKKQKIILKVVIGTVVLMFLFPPYPDICTGCHFYQSYFGSCGRADVRWFQLITQLIGVVIIGGAFFLLTSERKKER